jgi:hypothetical protein
VHLITSLDRRIISLEKTAETNETNFLCSVLFRNNNFIGEEFGKKKMKQFLLQLIKSKSYLPVPVLAISVTTGIYYTNEKKSSFRLKTMSSVFSLSPLARFSSSSNLFPLLRFHTRCDGNNKENNREETIDEDQEEEVEPKKARKPDHRIMIEDDTPENDAKWVEEKQHCSFCRSFLTSPCKEQFKKWSKCVDKAKEMEVDFIEGCSHYTKALMSCTEEHNDYFMALHSTPAEEEEEKSSSVAATETKEEKALEKKVDAIIDNRSSSSSSSSHLLHGDEKTIAENTSISAVEEGKSSR